ncbi:MAG: FAD-dependent monooxygenase, partial [Gemmatirosa sp.]|nr:FAD-dependent monooxygenase [Gemmatirosa sp.]
PAGSLTALRLARAGHRVALIDRRRFPRDKACGDGLIPDALAALARNGLLDRVVARGARWSRATVYGPVRACVDIDAELVTIRREMLDAELAAAAVEAGATLATGLAHQIDDRGERGATVRLAGGAAIDARLVGIATGANVALLERCGLLERASPSALAIRTYVHSTVSIDRPIVSFDHRILPGYGWIFPMGDGVFNVGCGALAPGDDEAPLDLRHMLSVFLDSFPLGRELAAGEQKREALRGAMLRCGLAGARPHAGGAVFAVGETIGTTFPLTGEGIGKALETAELGSSLADEALRGEGVRALSRLQGALQTRLRPKYRGYEFGAWCASRSWLIEWLLRRAQRRPGVRRAFSDILAERVDAAEVFSARGLVRALFLS